MQPDSSKITELLRAWGGGDVQALDELTRLVHDHLHRLARHYMAGERPGHRLQATALGYLRLVDSSRVEWQNRAHFFALAAQLMRRILVDFARSRGQQKRGGDPHKTSFDEALVISRDPDPDLVALNDALDSLAAWTRESPRWSSCGLYERRDRSESDIVIAESSLEEFPRNFSLPRRSSAPVEGWNQNVAQKAAYEFPVVLGPPPSGQSRRLENRQLEG